MKPYFSIIIPYYNSSATIAPLLDSIAASKNVPPLEVIIVDDGSSENFEFRISCLAGGRANFELLEKKIEKKKSLIMLRTVVLKKNYGPAVARNRGAEKARGKFLIFLDSDVVLFPDALANLYKIYQDDPDIMAVTGVWAKQQKTNNFFPNFKALRDWSYWIHERDRSGYYYLFSTRIASIKRAVFLRLKGFHETYAGPLVEDIEFTYRVARRYAIIFAPTVRVHHEFEDFWPIAKKYFWRSYYWTKLYQKRKKFDPVATTLQEAVSALSGVGVVIFSLIVPLWGCMIYDLGFMNTYTNFFFFFFLISYLLTLLIHILLIRKFLAFVYQEKGMWFAIRSFFMGLILYCFIATGALWGKVKKE